MTTTPRLPKYLTLTAAASLLGLSAGQAYELKLGTNVPPVDVHGFASQGFLYSSDYNYMGDTTRGSFRFSEAGLNVSLNPLPRTRIAAQAFLFDVGGVGEYEPFLDYASIEYTFSDFIGVRGGRVRRAQGIYNHIQDVDLARTWILLPQGVYDARWRDFNTSIDGGVFFGNVPLGKAGGLSYEVYGGVTLPKLHGGLGTLIDDVFYELQETGVVNQLDAFEPGITTGIQLWWNTPVNGLRLGGSFMYVHDWEYRSSGTAPGGVALRSSSVSAIPIQQYSIDYVWNSWTFQAEYRNLGLNGDQTTDMYMTVAPNMPPVNIGTMLREERSHQEAWYVSAACRINKYLEVGSYYSEYYMNTADRDGSRLGQSADGNQRDLAFLSVRFDPTDWLILKAEGHALWGTALVQNGRDNPSRDKSPWFMFATKATISF